MKIFAQMVLILFLFQSIAQSSNLQRNVPKRIPESHFQNRKFSKPIVDNILISNINSPARRASEEKVLVRTRRGIIGTGVKVAKEVIKNTPKRILKKGADKLLLSFIQKVGPIAGAFFAGTYKGTSPDIKRDGSVNRSLETKSSGTLEVSGSLYNNKINLIRKSSSGEMLEFQTYDLNIDSDRRLVLQKYLAELYIIKNGLPTEEELYEILSQDLDLDYLEIPEDLLDNLAKKNIKKKDKYKDTQTTEEYFSEKDIKDMDSENEESIVPDNPSEPPSLGNTQNFESNIANSISIKIKESESNLDYEDLMYDTEELLHKINEMDSSYNLGSFDFSSLNMADLLIKNKDLSSELDDLIDEREVILREIESSLDERSNIVSEIQEISKDWNDYSEIDIDDLDNLTIDDLYSKHHEIQNEIDDLSSELDFLIDEREEILSEMESSLDERSNIVSEIQEISKDWNDYSEIYIDDLDNLTIDDLYSKHHEIQNEIDDLSSELDFLIDEREEITIDLESLFSEYEDISNKIENESTDGSFNLEFNDLFDEKESIFSRIEDLYENSIVYINLSLF
ncbi:hypothetical protein AB834_02890 [PVC group bacterium (ex Bugula neritina AB1)]|nr:hypothetical protein AB834_02890 [PVC group bacterium (ex Bugula neritina AB1)]